MSARRKNGNGNGHGNNTIYAIVGATVLAGGGGHMIGSNGSDSSELRALENEMKQIVEKTYNETERHLLRLEKEISDEFSKLRERINRIELQSQMMYKKNEG